ncbi:snoRNA-binding protein [Serendipita sp. 396]|nr:snoRNA-binding protein [Serendipita sp. 396]
MPKEKKEKKAKTLETGLEDVDMADAAGGAKKKVKKEEIEISLEELSPIAHPLAQKKLAKKLHKTIRRASRCRQVKRGVKEVVKGIRKGEKGILVLAADISPMDIISHLPGLSEEHKVPYVFVSSKEELGHASSTKRPTSCVMICPNMKRRKPKEKTGDKMDSGGEEDDDYRELYDEIREELYTVAVTSGDPLLSKIVIGRSISISNGIVTRPSGHLRILATWAVYGCESGSKSNRRVTTEATSTVGGKDEATRDLDANWLGVSAFVG